MAIKLPVKDMQGRDVDEVELPAEIFEAPINVGLMHQAYVRQMANARLGTHKAKTRGEVSRTKQKWYRQKGTGRARHGSRNAPIFVGGGVAHGPQPRSYAKKMPRKMRNRHEELAFSLFVYILRHTATVIRHMNEEHVSMMQYIVGTRMGT